MPISRIVIVDNRTKETGFFTELLTDMGIPTVFNADNSFYAMEILHKKKVQFAIVSLDIQPTPGAVFVQQLRNMPEYRYLPICVYSNDVTDADITLMQQLGFDNILRPPFEAGIVSNFIGKLIQAEDTMSEVEKILRQVDLLMEEGKTAEAHELMLPNVLNDESLFCRANTTAGNLALLNDDLAAAKSSLNLVLKKDKTYAPAHYLEAKILSAEGKHEKAIHVLQAMVNVAPQNLSTLLNLGSAFIDADKLAEAKETLEHVAILDPDSKGVKEEMGKVAFKEGDLVRAKKLLAKTGQGIRLAKFFNEIAIQFVNNKAIDKGIRVYKDAIGVMEHSPVLYKLNYNLGLAYEKKQKFAEAFEYYAKAFLDNPSFEPAYAHIARIYKDREKTGVKLDQAKIDRVKKVRKKSKEGQEAA